MTETQQRKVQATPSPFHIFIAVALQYVGLTGPGKPIFCSETPMLRKKVNFYPNFRTTLL